MRVFSLSVVIAAVVTVATIAGSPIHAQNTLGEDHKNGLSLYLWATGIDGTFTIRGNEVPVDVAFDELFDKVEIAGSIHYERGTQPWGFLLDVTYIDMGTEFTEPNSQLPGTQGMTFLLSEVGAFRRWGPGENKTYFDLLLGLRYWDLEQTIAIGGTPVLEGSEGWVDGVFGGRIIVPMGNSWLFAGRLDVAAGGSEIAWNTSAIFNWQATDLLSLVFGYRFLKEKYETGSGADLFALDADFSGPVLALGFRW